jgi:hypothetical protein
MSPKLLALGTSVAIAAAGAVSAIAATTAPRRVTLSTPSSSGYKINRFANFNLRWNKDVYRIRSGGTLVFKNLITDPHTFSVLKKSQLPRTKSQINRCGAQPPAAPKYPPCLALYNAHAPDATGNPQNPVVNKGKPGIDKPGDSVFIPPKGAPQPQIKVTARPGTVLYFVCLVHPWMQAKLVVVK